VSPPLIRWISIKDYKSISRATVELGPFSVIVGPNGAGKSNFVDALSFVSDCVSQSVELAFRNRGGISAVRRLSTGHPTHTGIRLVIELGEGLTADYAFEIAAERGERFRISRERCVVREFLGAEHRFEVERGEFRTPIPGLRPRIAPDRLALFAASGLDEFRPLFEFLVSIEAYSIAPDQLRDYQEPDAGDKLQRYGGNAAAVLRRLQTEPESYEKYQLIVGALANAIPGLVDVEYKAAGQKDTIVFRQDVGSRSPWHFEAMNMSDGTLRLLGLLLAVYQPAAPGVVAIEEPEATVHPALAELIVQMLLDASHERQVVVTTHSPDILDSGLIEDDQIRVVTAERNRTLIAPVSEFGRQAIREKLYTPGELLRANELNPDKRRARAEQLSLFGAGPTLTV